MLNMHKPSDQAKLLFFALLRGTVSALATEPKVAAGVGLAVKNAPFSQPNTQSPVMSHIQLRLARKADVPSIQRCNLATLPENYNSQFYVNHLRQWPDLCLVAEDINFTEGDENNPNGSNQVYRNNNNDHRPFGAAFPSLGSNRPEPNVVAYVLGKVEERAPRIHSGFYSEGYDPRDHQGNFEDDDRDRFIGHVTSLAVLQPYRRQGLAAALMKQLHFHLEQSYGAGAVGLHVRKSNQAACRLYQDFGYQIDLIIPGYYQDGEDAYFMKKPLQLPSSPSSLRAKQSAVVIGPDHQGPRFPFLGRSRPQHPWEIGPLDLRLPRDLVVPDPNGGQRDPAAADEQNPGLLTGSL